MALKRSSGEAMMVMNLASPSERFEGHRPSHRTRTVYSLARGIAPPIDKTRHTGMIGLLCGAKGQFPVVAAMVM